MSLKTSHELKQLKSRQSKLKAEKEAVDTELHRLKLRQQDLTNILYRVKEKINKLTLREVIVTEHALLRYFERVVGYDLEAVKEDILDPNIRTKIDMLGSGKFPKTNYTVVVRDNTVISII